MWKFLKEFFGTAPLVVEPPAITAPPAQEFVFPVEVPTPNPKPDSLWKRGMWITQNFKVGILADFKGGDVVFHEVDPNTGETVKEYQVSIDSIRQARYYDIPACRMHVSRDKAKELGYGD